MSAQKRAEPQNLVLNSLHIVLAGALILISLVAHGRVPGLSADESAALGFVLFFGLGLPLALLGIGTLAWSMLSRDKWQVALAGALLLTVLAVANVWTGATASIGYLSFAIWTMAQRLRRTT